MNEHQTILAHHENNVLYYLGAGQIWLVYPRTLAREAPEYALTLIVNRPDNHPGNYVFLRSKLYLARVDPSNSDDFRDAYFRFLTLGPNHMKSTKYFTPHLFHNISRALIYVEPVYMDNRWIA